MKIIDWGKITPAEKKQCLLRPALRNRVEQQQQVQAILERVQREGDRALIDYTQQFDKITLNNLQVPASAVTQAASALSATEKKAIEHAADNIRRFHAAQQPQPLRIETQPGVICEKRSQPLSRVGLYIPGGSAPLISTTLMTGIPAQIAGCPMKILCTPASAQGQCHPAILYAAQLCDIEHIFLVGGAQAIAALAYGTESIPKVDKIFGPGNSWVTLAKTLVSLDPAGAAIDMPAGPSEVLVIADDDADPAFVASDLLAQAEHGPDSQVVLLCTSKAFITAVLTALEEQLATLNRQEVIRAALQHSVAIAVSSIEEALTIANDYAPEHLILHVANAASYKSQIYHAGSVFIGPWSPESMGDYASGTNHVLPTYGYARYCSGLSLMDFMRHTTFQELTQHGFSELADTVVTLAEMEGLMAHANAVKVRLKRKTT